MDRKTNIMLSSEDWARLVILEKELQRLEYLNKEPLIRPWLEVEIEKLKEKRDGS